MNKLKHIKKLIEKFYNGDTSIAEESELMEFFSGREDIPEELLEDKYVFTSMNNANKGIDVPPGLDERIIASLNKAEASESRGKRITLFSLSGLAAGLLIILSVYLGIVRNGNHEKQLAQYTIEDPEEAYTEIKRTLEFVSEKWNEGTGELKSLDNVNKSMKSLQPMNKLSSGSKELNLLGNLRRTEDIQIQ